MYLLFGGKDVAGKDPVFFLILTSILHLCFVLLYLLYLYSRAGKRTCMASSDLLNLQVLGLAFGMDFLSAGEADIGTLEYLNRPHGPIDLWVMLFQPGESEYKILLPNAGDHKHCSFVMSIILKHQFHYFLYWASFIWQSVNIIDWNRPGELAGVDSFSLYKL